MSQNIPAMRSFINTVYCPGCNERFQKSSESAICPRCGVVVKTKIVREVEETLLIKFPDQGDESDPSLSSSPDEAADELLGSNLHVYRCQSLLGSGGMGRVYLSRHRDLKRQCALKVLSPRTVAHDVDYAARFQLEGQAAAALIHPNIVTTHAIGEASGYHFLEMEFVPGRSLQQLVQDEGRLTPVRATALAVGITEGLAAAHRSHILHQDLKADNVLLDHAGVPKIADFGLAKRILPDEEEASLPTHLVGTPTYMAPELFQGESASPAADVYALGVCYFLMLCGRLPFVGNSLSEVMSAVTHQSLPNVRDLYADIPLEMAECLSLLLAKSPKNRPRDGIEAVQLLRAVLGQVRDTHSLLSEAFAHESDITWERRGDCYHVHVLLPDGRRQKLFVEPSDHSGPEQLLLIYSVCCQAHPEFYEEALRRNSELPHGSLAIREIEGKPMFVMINTYPRATVDVEEVKQSVLEVAYRADAVEKLLTGRDRY